MTTREYNTIHQWNLRHWVKCGRCSNCRAEKKTQWSNKSGDYKRDGSDWQELCISCHVKYDMEKFGRKGRRKKLSPRQLVEMKALYKKGGITQSQLGRQFGLVRETVNRLLNE